MGSDESHFNVSVGSDGQSHKTVSTNHNRFEEKGEPKRYRTEVLPLTARPNRLTLMLLMLIAFMWRYSPLSSRLTALERLKLFIARFGISTEVVYIQRRHGWCHMKLLPSRRVLLLLLLYILRQGYKPFFFSFFLWGVWGVHHATMHHVTSCKAITVRYMRI